jgi:kumamolisin
VVQQHKSSGTVKLTGTVAALQKAFAVDLKVFENEARTASYRGRTGVVHVPNEIADVVESVHGLDNRHQARPHFRLHQMAGVEAHLPGSSFDPAAVGTAYDFPTPTHPGQGQTIALVELGGGYRAIDLHSYFGANAPTVTAVGVNGATNHPTGNPNGPDGEVVLDIEVVGKIAPGAKVVVYFAPNTDAGFLNAINAAIHDKTNTPSIVSISWGSAEKNWTQATMNAFNQAFKDAATLGITVLVAAGDDGTNDNVNDGKRHVDFPASSPFVIGCGGTNLQATGATITSETVWGNTNDGATGGGVSNVFPKPSYQSGIFPKQSHRCVPDVAGDADPSTGYKILVDGVHSVFGGTSAVAPLYAGMFALINQQMNRRAGFVNPLLYQGASHFVHDITQGSNESEPTPPPYSATPGYDLCTGLGSLNGKKLLAYLSTSHAKAA